MHQHSIAELVDLHVLRCEVEGGKSPRTVQSYRYTLRRFLAASLRKGPRGGAVRPLLSDATSVEGVRLFDTPASQGDPPAMRAHGGEQVVQGR